MIYLGHRNLLETPRLSSIKSYALLANPRAMSGSPSNIHASSKRQNTTSPNETADKAPCSAPPHPAGAGRVIAREHRAQHAPRIPREGVVFREPPDEAGGPVFNAHKRIARPQSLGWRHGGYPTKIRNLREEVVSRL